MNASRAIVVNGLSRGGTNILWNILQSHPQVCSPIYETGELIIDHTPPFNLLNPSRAKRVAASPVVSRLSRGYLHRQFEKWKLRNLDSKDNNTKYEGTFYSPQEVQDSVICFKGVDSDIDLNGLLESIYQDVAHVVLVRNGYAVCNGWKRRGISPKNAGRKYASLLGKMLTPDNQAQIVIRFEDMLVDPFGTARRLFEKLGLQPTQLPKLRLKSKRVLKASGSHTAAFGKEGRKHWYGPDEISAVLDSTIDLRQIACLNDDDCRQFELKARDIMDELGYLSVRPSLKQ